MINKTIFTLLFLSVGQTVFSAEQLPHIVVFISDDLGRLETSIHGSVDVETPSMERIAKAGMVFDNAYVASPACCPNRKSFLTGLMPARHGAHPNHSKVKANTKWLLPILKSLGYYTASFGKIDHGSGAFEGLDFNSSKRIDMATDVVKHFSEKKISGPVCLFVGDRRPHVSWIKEPTYDPDKIHLPDYLIDTPETRNHWARYLTDISGMDSEMGRVYEFAQKAFGDDFIFVFTSDHGGQWPFGKWNLYDSGTRIPLVVAWPNHIKPNVRTNAFVSWVDILPTLIDLVGGKAHPNIDGKSFAPVLLGKTQTHRDKIFTTHTGDGIMNIFPIRSVRIGKYKYIHNLIPNAYHTNHSDRLRKDGAGAFWDSWDAAAKKDPKAAAIIKAYYTRPEEEFFDLENDPEEKNNLINDAEYAVQIQTLKSELAKWVKEQGDDLKPHKQPYLTSSPLPILKNRGKQNSNRKQTQSKETK
jgi:N-sulfoglucosamine sulfohydrolase